MKNKTNTRKASFGHSPKGDKLKILFVCVNGENRSRLFSDMLNNTNRTSCESYSAGWMVDIYTRNLLSNELLHWCDIVVLLEKETPKSVIQYIWKHKPIFEFYINDTDYSDSFLQQDFYRFQINHLNEINKFINK